MINHRVVGVQPLTIYLTRITNYFTVSRRAEFKVSGYERRWANSSKLSANRKTCIAITLERMILIVVELHVTSYRRGNVNVATGKD